MHFALFGIDASLDNKTAAAAGPTDKAATDAAAAHTNELFDANPRTRAILTALLLVALVPRRDELGREQHVILRQRLRRLGEVLQHAPLALAPVLELRRARRAVAHRARAEAMIRERMAEHLAAGASQIAVSPLNPEGRGPHWRLLEALVR